MTRDGFRAWRKRLGMSQLATAAALGISVETVGHYERGVRRGSGAAVAIPKQIRLAAAALSLGVTDYDGSGDPR